MDENSCVFVSVRTPEVLLVEWLFHVSNSKYLSLQTLRKVIGSTADLVGGWLEQWAEEVSVLFLPCTET